MDDEGALAQQVRSAMRATPILGPAEAASIHKLARAGSVRLYRKGSYLYHQGDDSDELSLLVTGRIEISSMSPGGHRQWHTTLEPPQFFGELGALGELPRSTSALVLDPASVWSIRAQPFLDFVLEEPAVGRELLKALARQVEAHGSLVDDLLFLDLKGRVAKRLLGLVSPSLDDPAPNGSILPMVTHADLASLAGGSRENVTRILSDFQKRGMIRREGRRYVLTDVRSLLKLTRR